MHDFILVSLYNAHIVAFIHAIASTVSEADTAVVLLSGFGDWLHIGCTAHCF